MNRTTLAIGLAATLALLAMPAREAKAAQPCPASAIQVLWSAGEVQSTLPDFSQAYAPGGYPAIASAAYDLPSGSLMVYRLVSGVSWTYVRAHDLYDIAGVAPGTPVSLTANLDLDGVLQSPGCGGSGCGGRIGGRVFHGAAAVADSVTFPSPFAGGDMPLHETLSLPLVIAAGTPTELEFESWLFVPAGGNAGGSSNAHIRFTGLPAGAMVVSCQGYVDAATPARRVSWGSLKSIYR